VFLTHALSLPPFVEIVEVDYYVVRGLNMLKPPTTNKSYSLYKPLGPDSCYLKKRFSSLLSLIEFLPLEAVVSQVGLKKSTDENL